MRWSVTRFTSLQVTFSPFHRVFTLADVPARLNQFSCREFIVCCSLPRRLTRQHVLGQALVRSSKRFAEDRS